MILHWDDATETHCNVPNFFPSVSAAVASFSPEKFIWRLFVGLHGAPRIVTAIAFRNFLSSSPLRSYPNARFFHVLCNFACSLHILEVMFLLLLTCVSSTENYEFHKTSFVGFIVCSVIYMFLSTFLFDLSGRRRTSTLGEKSYQYKLLYSGGQISSLILAMYFFYRHNTYCEPYVYSFFALSEYSVIIFNILFHSTAYYDFYGRRLSLTFGSSEYTPLPMHSEKRI
ncbi:hypothetical protein FO519_008783 [Halicephalobus sp. NKZ332]|nr:hypothetical protein FO519_008783 [Halicephalobus sp. NKZ332]